MPEASQTPPSQRWDAGLYDGKHAFVWEHGASLVELMAPQPGERILDLGCGTGHLTAQIAAAGAEAVGIDAAEGMIERAREQYPQLRFRVAQGQDFALETPVDAVFSSAALHWMSPPQ